MKFQVRHLFQLRLNNRNRGIYAFEENPDEQLAAIHKRPKSVVVRFSEDAFWYNVKRQVDEFGQFLNSFAFLAIHKKSVNFNYFLRHKKVIAVDFDDFVNNECNRISSFEECNLLKEDF